MLPLCDMIYDSGALAQLGAHNTGSVGVRGSNPLCSTKRTGTAFAVPVLLLNHMIRTHE